MLTLANVLLIVLNIFVRIYFYVSITGGRAHYVLSLALVIVIVLDIIVHIYAYLTGATLVLTLAHVHEIVLDIFVHIYFYVSITDQEHCTPSLMSL